MIHTKDDSAVLGLFYKLIQCLHHLSLMHAQLDGRITKAFSLKLNHLNDFIRPANSGPKIRFHIEEINKSWITNITNILISHYNYSISGLISQISMVGLNSLQTQDVISKTIQKASKRFGKKLSRSTVTEFKNLLFNLTRSCPNIHNKTNHNTQTNTPTRNTYNHRNNYKTSDKTQRHQSSNNKQSTAEVRFVKGHRDPLSNFFPCKFNFMGQTFRSVEHAYQYEKANFFGLDGLANRIRDYRTAFEAKHLAREVPRSTNWEKSRMVFMNQLLKLKWDQVSVFRKELNNQKHKQFVHPVSDPYWGVGRDNNGRDMFACLLQNLSKVKANLTEPSTSRQFASHSPTLHQNVTETSNRFQILTHSTSIQSHSNQTQQTNKQTAKPPTNTQHCITTNVLSGVTPPTPTSTSTHSTTSRTHSPSRTDTPVTSSPISSPWKEVSEPSGVSLTDFPPLASSLQKPQRQLRRSRRTEKKRGPPSSTSPSCPPPPNKCNKSVDKTLSFFPVIVQTHKTDKSALKADWSWPEIEQDTVVIGDENVGTLTASPNDNVQFESYPGAHFQNFTNMLKEERITRSKSPKHIILSVGMNDRCSDPNKTSCRNLKTMMTSLHSRYPSSDIIIHQINYSQFLPKSERINIDIINKSMLQYTWAKVIPKLEDSRFKISSSDSRRILWSEDTGNTLLHHWLSHLN